MEKESEPSPQEPAATTAETPVVCGVCDYPKNRGCRLCAAGEPRFGPGVALLDFMRGFVLYWRGAIDVLTHKAYLGKIRLAVALSIILFVALAALAIWGIHPGIVALLGVDWLPSWVSSGTALMLTIVAAFFAFPVLVTLFLFPVLDPMSRLAEEDALGFAPPPHARGAIADFWDSMDTGARILLYEIIGWLVCLPVVVLFAPIGVPLALLVSGFFAGFAWIDYPASRRGLNFGQKWRIARRHWAQLTGFGLAFLFGLLIPFFNVCAVGPAGAVGAAPLWFGLHTQPDDAVTPRQSP